MLSHLKIVMAATSITFSILVVMAIVTVINRLAVIAIIAGMAIIAVIIALAVRVIIVIGNNIQFSIDSSTCIDYTIGSNVSTSCNGPNVCNGCNCHTVMVLMSMMAISNCSIIFLDIIGLSGRPETLT